VSTALPPSRELFWRALVAFLVLPGTVAFLVPWLLRPDGTAFHWAGVPTFIFGTALLLWCTGAFYVAGRGSLAPWAPPERLVISGPYRVSRNPMYVAVLLILSGWALGYRTRSLWIYSGALLLAFHLRVLFYEEPWLARTHRDAWTDYASRVPRWLFRLHRPIGGRPGREAR